jgi:hypothetical protein
MAIHANDWNPCKQEKNKNKNNREKDRERELVPSMACFFLFSFISPKFVMWVGWQSCTRGLCQIWLGALEGEAV